ncbi:MAG TPA: hypothetical protein VFL72_05750 [Acidimicrobiia bacterium]|nr:hypothetical protein [Acidimicrobiia bacterium]
MTVRQTPLGVNQTMVLESLKRHGGWPGGWVWENPSLTRKILNSLVRRGLAEVNQRLNHRTGDPYDFYTAKEVQE